MDNKLYSKLITTQAGDAVRVDGVRNAPMITTRFGSLMSLQLSVGDARAFAAALIEAIRVAEGWAGK